MGGKSARKKKKRIGMTLVELLGVMVVLAILATIGVGSVLKAAHRGRVTSCFTAIDGYRSAFLSAVVSHPSVFSDRISNWKDDGEGYSAKDGLKRVAAFMNESLDDNLHFYWNEEEKYYETIGNADPWGGKYILTEYPISESDPDHNYYNASETGNGYKMFACSIWATGNNEALLSDRTDPGWEPIIVDDSFGVCLTFADGIVDWTFNGFESSQDEGDSPFVGYKLTYK